MTAEKSPDEVLEEERLRRARKKKSAILKLLKNHMPRRSRLDLRKGKLPARLFDDPLPWADTLDENK